MKRLAVVVCNSGLGHINRVLHLIDLLCRRSPGRLEIVVFVDLTKLHKFPALFDKLEVQKNKVNFFDIQAGVLEYEQEFIAKYKNELEQADIIWSDNLIFPLKYRKEVFLTGSFLWFEVMPEHAEMKREEEVFFSRQPILIGNKDFTVPRLQAMSSFVGVGIYNYFPDLNKERNGSQGILLSCGGTEGARGYFQSQLPKVRKILKEIGGEAEIFVEQDFYADLAGPGVKPADFSHRMFKSVAAAVIRPGMGTVCDTLSSGGRIFAFCEEEKNFEVRHNSLVLEKLDVGFKCDSIDRALHSALEYLKNAPAREEHRKALRKLDFNGLEQTVEKIREILN